MVSATVIPERLLLMILKAPSVTDIQAWHAIETEHRVELMYVKDAYSFTPRLTVQYLLSGVNTADYKTIVRFDYLKNRTSVRQWYEVRDFRPFDRIQPDEPFLLSTYVANQTHLQQNNHQEPLSGMWKVATHVAFVRSDLVSNLPVSQRERRAFFATLRLTFKEVATFEFEVIGLQPLVDPGGTLIRPRGQTITIAEYSIDEI